MAEPLARAAGLLIYRKRNDRHEYLLLQASYEPYHWTPPKGHVDPGEEEYATAIRETEEEAGIKANQLEIHKDFKHEMHYMAKPTVNHKVAKPKRVIYWLARLKSDAPVVLSDEHKNLRWSELKDAIELSKFLEMEKLLKSAEEYLTRL